jgi:predicted outer membrane repeat protein
MTVTTRGRSAGVVLGLCAALLVPLLATPAGAQQTFTVNVTQDVAKGGGVSCNPLDAAPDCSLRAAFEEAWALHGVDDTETVTIRVPAGTYPLTIDGPGVDPSAGDLRTRGPVTLVGDGRQTTVIDAGTVDATDTRVFNDRIIAVVGDFALTVRAITLTGGSTTGNGGAIENPGGTTTVNDAEISGNAADSNGGGIYTSSGTIDVTNSVLNANRAGASGGGIRASSGTVIVTGSTFEGNEAVNNGGAIRGSSTTITVTDTLLRGNAAEGNGGALRTASGAITVVGSTVSGNTAGSDGGGVRTSSGAVTVTNSTLADNTAGEDGGALRTFDGPITVTRSTLAANTAVGAGGGIYTLEGAIAVTASTLSGNASDVTGGAIHVDGAMVDSDTTDLVETTVAGNTAPTGGGLSIAVGAQATLLRSIVAGNTGGDCDGPVSSSGFSLDSDDTCGLVAAGDLPGVNPLLGPLADNGGPTPTRALAAGSPAVNAAGAVCSATDQRGVPRPQQAACDIGAFELGVGSVAGTVATQQDGTPLEGAQVTLTPPGGGPAVSTTTGAGGAYAFVGVTEQSGYTVATQPAGHAPAAVGDVRVVALATTTVDLRPVGLPVVTRLSGPDRFATAAAVSAARFAPGVGVAFIATGGDFPDALSGGVAAALADAPLLLTRGDVLPAATRAELQRLAPGRIVILGGTAAVSDAVAGELTGLTTGPVTRLRGPDRFGTAAAVSAATFGPGVPVAYIATGANFPDALTGVPAAAAGPGPLLLVTRDAVPAATRTELQRLGAGRIVILGGTAVVSAGVAAELAGLTTGPVSRLAGPDRLATATAISAATFPGGASTAYVATGGVFPDALAGGAVAGAIPAPVLLVSGSLPDGVRAELVRLGVHRIVILGGTAAVSTAVENQLRQVLGLPAV